MSTCSRSVRSPSGSAVSSSPSSARWPTRAAHVRVFSDDGKCVHDAVLMRRALEYVKAFDGVVAQHAQEPRLTEDAQMNEGAVSGVLGLRGWPAVAEEAIIARDVLLAEHVGSRLHVCHVSTAGSVEIVRTAKARGVDVTAEVTPHHLLLTEELVASYDPVYKVNPPLRTEADVQALREALADGTIDAVAHRPRAALGGGQGLRVERRGLRHGRARDRPRRRRRGDGRDRSARLGRRRRPHVGASGADRAPGRPRPPDRRRASPPTSCSSTRTRARTVDGRRAGEPQPQLAVRGSLACPRGWSRPSCAVVPPCSTASSSGREREHANGTGTRRAGARGRPGLPRSRLRRGGRDLRRGGLLHRHDRLPGDPHRPVVPPAGRRADRAAHRQLRRERRRRRVAPDLGGRLRRARPLTGARRTGGRSGRSTTTSSRRASSASATSTRAP